jgi:hypothetical protein
MGKLWAVLFAILLGLSLGACSKCDVPDMLPKSCRTGPGTSQIESLKGEGAATPAPFLI